MRSQGGRVLPVFSALSYVLVRCERRPELTTRTLVQAVVCQEPKHIPPHLRAAWLYILQPLALHRHEDACARMRKVSATDGWRFHR